MKQVLWLRYSLFVDFVYCGYCYLFGVQVFRIFDWFNILKFVDRYVGENVSYYIVVVRGQVFIDVYRGVFDIRQ